MGGAWSSKNERRETVYAVVPFIRQAKDRARGIINSLWNEQEVPRDMSERCLYPTSVLSFEEAI